MDKIGQIITVKEKELMNDLIAVFEKYGLDIKRDFSIESNRPILVHRKIQNGFVHSIYEEEIKIELKSVTHKKQKLNNPLRY